MDISHLLWKNIFYKAKTEYVTAENNIFLTFDCTALITENSLLQI